MADDPYPVITRGGVGSGVRMWDHDSGEFTNRLRIIEDEVYRAEGNPEPGNGAPATALIFNAVRALASGDKLLSVRNGDVERLWATELGHPVLETPVWDDFRVGANVVQMGPINQPSWDVFIGNVRAPHFTVGEEVFFDIQTPHRWKAGSAVGMHVHWSPNGAVVNADDQVKWEIEYEVTDQGGVYVGTTIITGEETMAGGTAQKTHIITRINNPADMDLTAFEESCVVVCRLRRVAASVQEYGGSGVLLSVDLHHRVEKLGTTTEYTPFSP